jgi:chemotaxis protein CheC
VRLTPAQTDIFQELVNIGVGKAADALHDMLGSQVQLTVPMVKVVTPWELKVEMASIGGGQVAAVQDAFTGPFTGVAQALFPSECATQILSSLSDEGTGSGRHRCCSKRSPDGNRQHHGEWSDRLDR